MSRELRARLHNAIGDCCFGREGTLVSWLRSPNDVEQYIYDKLAAAEDAPTLEMKRVGNLEMAVGLLSYIKSCCKCSSCAKTAAQVEELLTKGAEDAPTKCARCGALLCGDPPYGTLCELCGAEDAP